MHGSAEKVMGRVTVIDDPMTSVKYIMTLIPPGLRTVYYISCFFGLDFHVFGHDVGRLDELDQGEN